MLNNRARDGQCIKKNDHFFFFGGGGGIGVGGLNVILATIIS